MSDYKCCFLTVLLTQLQFLSIKEVLERLTSHGKGINNNNTRNEWDDGKIEDMDHYCNQSLPQSCFERV